MKQASADSEADIYPNEKLDAKYSHPAFVVAYN